MILDRYAYASPWRGVHPAPKAGFAVLGLGAALAAASPAAALLILLIVAGLTLYGARLPLGAYLRLVLLPAGFLLVSTAGLALTFGSAELPLLPGVLGLSRAGLNAAALAASRAMAAVASLYFLALTTPLPALIDLLRRLRVPALLLELTVLAYRQLFTFLAVAAAMRVAQQARLGYATPANSLRSLAALGANLYLRSHQRGRQLYRSLLARGYESELRWLGARPPLAGGPLLAAAAGGCLLLALARLVPA